MTYRVNEIFYSLQGEGYHAGTPAAFVRLSGCNLACPFCDTDHKAFTTMTADEIAREARRAAGDETRLLVLTGGEPTLQADDELIDTLHSEGFYVAMESNGTRLPPKGVDWLTVSPKCKPAMVQCDELKLVFTDAQHVDDYGIEATHRFLQPCDVGDAEQNRDIMRRCVAYIMQHPWWRLSLQVHKLAGFK